jgi:division protein CdvB (Snf7/Vps24/ESCRT-III family)
MASRLDACASRIETAVRMGQVTTSMQGVVKGMDKGLKSMNIEEISKTMDRFEQVRKRVLRLHQLNVYIHHTKETSITNACFPLHLISTAI